MVSFYFSNLKIVIMKIIHEGVLNMEPGLSLSQLIKKGEYDSVHGFYNSVGYFDYSILDRNVPFCIISEETYPMLLRYDYVLNLCAKEGFLPGDLLHLLMFREIMKKGNFISEFEDFDVLALGTIIKIPYPLNPRIISTKRGVELGLYSKGDHYDKSTLFLAVKQNRNSFNFSMQQKSLPPYIK